MVAQNHNPTILNPDFLKHNDIVPGDWNLKRAPICVEPMAEVFFENDIKINAQLDKVIFFEPIKENKKISKLKIILMAKKYVETLRHVKYTAVGINPIGHIIFDTYDSAKGFMSDNFIKSGPWKEYDEQLTNIRLNLSYKFSDVEMNLSINPSAYRIADKESLPVLLLGANFHHTIDGKSYERLIPDTTKIIMNWQSDIKILEQFINKLPL